MQRDIVWEDTATNMRRAEADMPPAGSTDLVVLPEVFATGFGAKAEDVAQPSDGGEVLQWMKRMAHEHDYAVAGSVAVENLGFFYNRLYFVRPDGEVTYYDKRHLFTYGGEVDFTPGQERVIAEWRGVRFLLLICFDLRFPLWNRCFEDYDVALYVGSWPVARVAQWSALLPARAIENQCYVVAVNRVGKDPVCDYNGQSVVLHPYGHTLLTLGNAEQTSTINLNMEELYRFRDRAQHLKDADLMLVNQEFIKKHR